MPIISAPRVLTGDHDLGAGWVAVDDGRIAAVGAGQPPRPADVPLPSGVLAPGLVDAQINGAYGVDFAAADDDGWRAIVRRLPETGVTALVPTVITAPVAELVAALRRYATLRPQLDALPGAARTLGLHVEGPFLSARRRGAHREDLLIDPDPDAVQTLLAAGADGALRCLTLAPERHGALAAIATLTSAGVRVAVGHSDADAATVHAAADAGATLVTHLFNGQRPLHHRDPGVVGAALVDRRLVCGLIADGEHVADDAIALAFAAASGRIMLVTDALAALGMPPGRYLLGGDEVIVADGEPPRRPGGSIAGSAARLDDCVARAVAVGVPLAAAVEAATRIPADAVGRPDLGRIAAGGPADLVWLDAVAERPLRARATWLAGVPVHGAPTLPIT
jgi:N-acetylglucosamine-6-phosphate deacetylase